MVSIDEIEKLPKVELHAHLTGSVRDLTILDLLKHEILENIPVDQRDTQENQIILKERMSKYKVTSGKSMEQCFDIFGLLHHLLKKRQNLIRVTKEILEDFSIENTVYLELRTTPRVIYDGDTVLSKKEYINIIIDEIEAFKSKSDMIVRLILSVDRTKGLNEAIENVKLCNEIKSKYIVGVDFSGNPSVSSFQNYGECFKLIKDYNLKTTVHIAETWKDPDLDYILKEIRPERIGHAVCLNKEYQSYLLANQIPIEICPTSNLITKLVSSIDEHPFFEFYGVDRDYPLVICTDDRGMFNTSQTHEQFLIAKTFKLSLQDIYDLNMRTLKFIFDESEATTDFLQKKFEYFKLNNLKENRFIE